MILRDRTPASAHTKNRVAKQCSVCNEEFLISPGLANRYKTCSHECFRARLSDIRHGALNPLWQGDAAVSASIHAWLIRNHPKSGTCEECGAEGKTDHAFLYHPQPNTRNRADYREVCRRCHMAIDATYRARRKETNVSCM